MKRVVLVICVLLSTAARAQPSAREVLANVRRAIGSPVAFHAAGEGVFLGNRVPFTLDADARGRYVASYAGPVPLESGFDGAATWARDLGGEVRPSALSDASEAKFGVWALTGYAFDADSTVVFERVTTEGDNHRVAFSFDEGRITGTVTVSAADWRPLRWEYSDGTTPQTIELSGVVPVGGSALPAHVVQTSGWGMVIETTLQSAEVADLSPAHFAMPPEVAADIRFDPGVPAMLECKRAKTGHVLVRPLVAGKDVGWFIFDTGAGAMCLDTRAAAELALAPLASIPAVGVGGAAMSNLYRPDSIAIGPVMLASPLTVELKLAFLDQHLGEKIAGIVGYNLLARCVAVVDLSAGRVSLHEPGVYRLPDGAAWVSIVVNGRTPTVRATFEGHEGLFTLDTGASGSAVVIFPHTARRLNLLDGRETTESRLGGVGGFIAARTGTLAWLDLGGVRHENLSVSFASESKGAFANRYLDGNIGVGVLSKSVLVFDYPESRMAFIPGEAADAE